MRAYELINQLTHHYTVLVAAEWIKEAHPASADMYWEVHGRQTGGGDKADINIHRGPTPFAFAEVTAASSPQGGIWIRLRNTLTKLAGLGPPGICRYMFVVSESMERAARELVARHGLSVKVQRLNIFDEQLRRNCKKQAD